MARILAVGIATLDIINTVASYPDEDQEVRALSQRRVRGGNATNTLVVLSQLGHACSWAGVLPQEPDAERVTADLDRYGVDYSQISRPGKGKLPTSYIAVSASSGSRTIVHFRDCPEYEFEAFDRLNLSDYDWIHFEGRNIPSLEKMLKKTRLAGIPCSLEVEKPRKQIEALFSLPDVLIFSRAYVQDKGYTNATDFIQQQSFGRVIVPWGEKGVWYRGSSAQIHQITAPAVSVVDSLGAGDVFNAGLIHGLVQQHSLPVALQDAINLASAQCTKEGLVL